MKYIFMLIFALLVLVPSSFAQWQYNSQQLITDVTIRSYADIKLSSPNGYVESATVNMTFFPIQAETQDLLKFETDPDAEVNDRTMKFTWRRPENRIDFSVNAQIKTANSVVWVKNKIKFPLEDLPEDVMVFTKPTVTIDSNDEDIIKLASELVKGENDMYSAVFTLAEWTKNNVEYNLSTLTAEVSEKASWVLDNRQGVCDELTSLFIALNRAVGIPARFISGIAYTESDLFPDRWGPHGWAEVYFPDYGWVPFDVTYGQLGWVDPTHIKFKESADSDDPSTYYQWLGKDADLVSHKLEIKANVAEKIGSSRVPLKIEASVLKKAVNFGSYNLVEAAIENPNDFYYSNELYLNNPREVQIIGKELKAILLLPGEKKKIYWILKIDSTLDSRYSYTFPIVVKTINNISSETGFEASVREKFVSSAEVEEAAGLLEEEKQKEYSGNVFLQCSTPKNEFYTYEDVNLTCNAKNTGNVFLQNAEVCFENRCSKIDLGISQSKNVSFAIDNSPLGQRQEILTLRNELVSKSAYVSFNIKDKPNIGIENIIYPVNVSYGQNFTITFTLAKKSLTNPRDAMVVFSQNGIEEKWVVGELNEDRKFVVNLAGSELVYGTNNYGLTVYYNDELNQRQSASKNIQIELTGATPTQRMLLAFNIFAGTSTQGMILILLAGTIVFLAVVLVIFRKKTEPKKHRKKS